MAKQWAKSFYNSKAWKSVRAVVLHRDMFTCQLCDGRATEVHHIIELDADNINDKHISLNPENLRSLCGSCHKAITKSANECDENFFFDEDGQLVPIPPLPTKKRGG